MFYDIHMTKIVHAQGTDIHFETDISCAIPRKIRATGRLMYTAGSIIEGEEARHDACGEDMNTKWRIIVTIFVIGVTAISLYVNP